jgi:ubiquinone/menaquinone biosynthesis C-methylase UbiE
MTGLARTEDYQRLLAAESAKWGNHLTLEGSGEWHSWLSHPLIREHYHQRACLEGRPWQAFVREHLRGPAARSLDLGCGSGSNSLRLWEHGATRFVEGVDVSAARVAEGERLRRLARVPGEFREADVNTLVLTETSYDVIFSCHSFHHFLNLEHVLAQVARALTPTGLFVLEEFVGPTQFQWTAEQRAVTKALLARLPARLRTFRWGAVKTEEGRPTPQEVATVSPFESIRSAEIVPLFVRHFDVVAVRPLGGTIQHLLYNGIAHNFGLDDPEAVGHVRIIARVEDALLALGALPSDFQLLVGRRK